MTRRWPELQVPEAAIGPYPVTQFQKISSDVNTQRFKPKRATVMRKTGIRAGQQNIAKTHQSQIDITSDLVY